MKRYLLLSAGIILLAGFVFVLSSTSSFDIRNAGIPFADSAIFGGGKAKILFVGDMMFDRTIRKIGETKGYDHFFSCVRDYFHDFDFVVANLEGPITDESSLSRNTKPGEAGNTTFTFDAESAVALARNNVGYVSLGNNHIFDFGIEGAKSTKEALKDVGVGYFGAPGDSISASTTIRGVKIAIVSFNQFLGEGDPQRTISSIWKEKRNADYVIVYAHWGEEYVPTTEYVRSIAHSFVDAGADLVLGSHPHVIQEKEIYNGKNIYYSLGNFIFDQYWVDEVKLGGGVALSIDGGKASLEEERFDVQRDGRTCLID